MTRLGRLHALHAARPQRGRAQAHLHPHANIQNDVGTVLTEAGIAQLRAEVLRNLTEGTVTQMTIAPGTRIEWMALRRSGPRIIRNLQWDGRAAVPRVPVRDRRSA